MIVRCGRARSSGFTLIELVLSAALMSMILSAAYLCLKAGVMSRKLIEEREAIFQSARVAMARLTADLRSACPLSPKMEFVGLDRQLGDTEADNLDFGTRHFRPKRPGESDFAETSYFLGKETESGQLILWRRQDSSPDPEPLAGGTREEIARGLTGLRFEYYDGFEWYDEWGDAEGNKAQSSWRDQWNLTGLPEAVRITLWFGTVAPDPEKAASEQKTKEPPFEFQTVVRLNLAALSQSSVSSSSSSSSSSRNPAGPSSSGPAAPTQGRP